jgi:tripartite-type tricarboxylate transporter receptor subunit TctC
MPQRPVKARYESERAFGEEESMRRRTLCTLLAMSGWALPAVGQPLAKTTTIIVPFAPGGSGDITARLIGQFWLEAYGLTVVVETKPGANGIIGMQSAKNAPADGKTLVLATTSTLAANPSLFRTLPYDAEKDFSLVAVTGGGAGSFMFVRTDAPYTSLAEFVSFARAHPQELHYGYFNASSRVPPALLAIRAGIELTPVPYRQIGTATNDLASGQIHTVFVDTTAADAFLTSNRFRGIGLTAPKRSQRSPDIPTIAESYPDFEVSGFLGIAVRAETPEQDKREINRRVNAAIVAEPMKSKLMDFGYTVDPLDLEACIAYAHAQRRKWAGYVQSANIEPL